MRSVTGFPSVAVIAICVMLAAMGAPVARSGLLPQTAPPGEDAATLERDLHAGRFGSALLSIRRQLDANAVPRPDGSHLSPVELAVLAAVLVESSAPIDLVAAERLSPTDRSAYWYGRGLLSARAAWPGGRPDALASAREAAGRLDALAATEGRLSRVEVRRVSVLAAIAGAQEEREELALLLAHARRLESQMRGLGAPDDRLVPLDELAGDLWLQIHRFDAARQGYRETVGRQPGRTRAWFGLARAARDAGAHAEAREAARRVLSLWTDAPGLSAAKEEMRAILGTPGAR